MAGPEHPAPGETPSDKVRDSHSYGQILKSSSIIGGAQAINYVIAMVRTKVVAILLGPSGVGLVGLYVSATELVGALAGLGISSSGVREVAEAHGSGETERIAHTVKTLRRMCWATGLLGWGLAAALAYPLSVWAFGSSARMWAIAVLGATIFLSAISGGQSALLQGTRRIGDLARSGVVGAVIGSFVAIGLYAWLGEKGIVPVLLSTALVNLGISWWFARRIHTAPVTQSWIQTFTNSKRLISLGVAFMYGALLAALVALAIRAVILRTIGIDANGIYQAAWAISGMFAGFIIGAMGTDFYPRLTAAAGDNQQVNRLVNEQIEIGVLLALPGVLATLSFAPWLIRLLYSAKFTLSAELLPWFAIGIYGQVITYPLGFIQRAKGRAGWVFLSQTHLNLLYLILSLFMIKTWGVVGAPWAFAAATYLHGIVVFGIARRLSRFGWTRASVRLTLSAAGMVGLGFLMQAMTHGLSQFLLGTLVTTAACLLSLRGISSRLGADHRIVRIGLKFPGARIACGL